MNKNEFVDALSAELGVSKAEATKMVNAFWSVIKKALKNGEEIKFVGIGTFFIKETPAKEGRNPRTGEPITIAASKQPKFKPGKELKDEVNS